MVTRPIVVVPHPVLSKRALDVANIDDDLVKLAQEMAETMYRAPGIGLAANQVGQAVRLIVVDVDYAYADAKDKKKNPIVVINPKICLAEGEAVKEEGCLSVPDFAVEVVRASQVQVRGVDLNGNPIVLDADEIFARVLQHEIDHLNGKTLLEYASILKRSLYNRKLKKKARKQS